MIELAPTPETVNLSRRSFRGEPSTDMLIFEPGWAFGESARTNVSSSGVKVRTPLGTVTVKSPELVAVPPGAVIEMGPVLAPDGTVAVICVSELIVKLPDPTLVPLNCTSVAPAKPEPSIVTDDPTCPEVGEKPVIGGAGGAESPQDRVPVWSALPFVFL